MPIRLRLTLLSAAGALALSAIAGVIFVHLLEASLRSSTDASLRSTADSIVSSLETSQTGTDLPDPSSGPLVDPQRTVSQIVTPDGSVGDASDTAGGALFVDAKTLRRAHSRTITTDGRVEALHKDMRILATPVVRTDGTWVVVVATSLTANRSVLQHVVVGILIGAILVVLVAGCGAWLLSTLALRPVERMRRQAAILSTTSGDAQLDVPTTGDEIARLGQTMNDLLHRLGASLARQRSFVADAGHELRTPITLLMTELELAGRDGRTREELCDAVNNARDDAGRLAMLADQLLFLAARDEPGVDEARDVEPIALLIEHCADRSRRLVRGRAIRVEADVSIDLVAPVVADDVERAVDNLLANAARHAPEGSTIEITARVVHCNGDHCVEIVVRDHGPGFPTDFLPHAFERFRRADMGRKSTAGGAGLGLAIVHAVAVEHGGQAHIANAPSGGAVAGLTLSCSLARSP
jgi:signal transduction histidine kinase